MHALAMTLGRTALVVKEFSINYEGPEYIHIVARKGGLIAWFLTLCGIDVTTVMRVFADRIEFQEGSVSGQLQTVVPLKSISVAFTGYTKPFVLLILTGLCVLAAPFTFGATLILALVFVVYYFLKKTLLISVISNSGFPLLICFKRSVIEGVSIDYPQAQETVNIINQLLMQRN